MNKRVTAIIEEARKLTHEERRDLLDQLQLEFADDEVAEGTPEEIEAAWTEEIERRVAAHERGETSLVGSDEIFDHIRERLGIK